MKTTEISYSTINGSRREYIVDPDSTEVTAVAEAGRGVLALYPDFKALGRSRGAALAAAKNAKNVSKEEARAAGARGDKYDAKAAKARRKKLEEVAEDIDLEWEAAAARLDRVMGEYREIVEHYAPALRAEALANVDAAILTLATASRMAQQAESVLAHNLGILGGIGEVAAGGSLTPRAVKAGGKLGGYPVPWISEGRGKLGQAIALAAQVLDEQREVAKSAELLRKLEQEADDAEDLDEDDDDDLDDDDDDED